MSSVRIFFFSHDFNARSILVVLILYQHFAIYLIFGLAL